ncbi:Rho GTPase activation protein [Gorgonomyces haynaldii]|nr:Rho GTPase activation protein [Gorgonomyces haynaldii]
MDLTAIVPSILKMLTANNYFLLECLCQCSFVGENAQTIAKGIMTLLDKDGILVSENFLMRLFRKRAHSYLETGQDISSITRDNGTLTMLLSVFANTKGREYLKETLSPALLLVAPILEKIEIDVSQYDSTVRGTNDAEKLNASRTRLRNCFKILFKSILDSQERMPSTLRRMCLFFNETVQEVVDKQTSGELSPDSFMHNLFASTAKLEAELLRLPSFMTESSIGLAVDTNGVDKPQTTDSPSVTRNLGYLTVAERVIGSFIFLRFFLPAITSPDTQLLPQEHQTPDVKKGLLKCGKMITALCNDVDFGVKDKDMVYFNEYLNKYREHMHIFLGAAAVPLSSDATLCEEHSLGFGRERAKTASLEDHLNTGRLSKKKKAQFTSFDNLQVEPPTDKTVDAMLLVLHTHMDKIIGDLQIVRSKMPDQQSDILQSQVRQMGTLLDICFSQPDDKDVKQNWLSSIKRKLKT